MLGNTNIYYTTIVILCQENLKNIFVICYIDTAISALKL